MSARPTVTVQKTKRTVPLPNVFTSPLRYDIVQFVHTAMRKNARHPYAVSRRAGHQTSAESWGTGRAVARIPRVSGGGTSRSGQGAFGNMCRGGRMFAPTKVFRKWTAKANVKVKRLAVKAALAASAVPALVMARGHNITRIPEIPLVVPNKVECLEKTKDAVKLLKTIGAYQDLERVKNSKHLRPGVGKFRNRRYVKKKGPLIVFSKRCPAIKAFRSLPGIDINFVSALNLLKLAPGGTFGRLTIFSEGAFNQLDKKLHVSARSHLPDSKRVINSAEVQSVIRARKAVPRKHKRSRKPELNPAAKLVKLERKNAALRKERITKDWTGRLRRKVVDKKKTALAKLKITLIRDKKKRKEAMKKFKAAVERKANSKQTKRLEKKYKAIRKMIKKGLAKSVAPAKEKKPIKSRKDRKKSKGVKRVEKKRRLKIKKIKLTSYGKKKQVAQKPGHRFRAAKAQRLLKKQKNIVKRKFVAKVEAKGRTFTKQNPKRVKKEATS